jgi:tripartite-type tricarboxylate transporter receptor subunit TctC
VEKSATKRIRAALAVVLGVGIAASATAHIGVGKAITLMVPYPAGGPSDAIAHLLTPALAT